jgi:hypothetical protein
LRDNETRVQAFLHALATTRGGASGEKPLAALENQRQALAAWSGEAVTRVPLPPAKQSLYTPP